VAVRSEQVQALVQALVSVLVPMWEPAGRE